ncbi:hypothetical protein AB0M97_08490 [Streptomyces sp. NPDC051207]
MMHGCPPLEDRLQVARLDHLTSSRAAETDVAEACAGLPVA